jgi:EAL domain-containing protein (putative c-di-GMP-specific phosphodiesterase class I)
LQALDFPDIAAAFAAELAVDPSLITLEITEGEVMGQLSTALDVISRLRLKRFRLAIDDFGTGYSSLAQLRDLPFDELKIDRGFVHGASGDVTLRAICCASSDATMRRATSSRVPCRRPISRVGSGSGRRAGAKRCRARADIRPRGAGV